MDVYTKIKQLKEDNYSQRDIAKMLGVSRNTVQKYVDMNGEEFHIFLASTKQRKQKLDTHKDQILKWLRKHPAMKAAQIHDWLEERGYLGISESTLRRYVKQLREDYDIPKVKRERDYMSVEDPDMGEQAQIDFGQIKVRINGATKTIYCVAFVLSHSRYKYMEWWDSPYTTQDVINAHENAFHYFSGMPRTIVYDQDRTIFVDENYGDLILTTEFESYRQSRRFKVHACRGSDPESKGRVENVIGFIKKNFSDNRVYTNIDSWNRQGEQWLVRRANGKIHNTTKKIPAEVFEEERKHLIPIGLRHEPKIRYDKKMERSVHKDNIIHFEGNRYSVPLGTYNKIKKVYAHVSGETLKIMDPETGQLIATHTIWTGKGQLIQDRSHQRDYRKTIEKQLTEAQTQFSNTTLAQHFFIGINDAYPRYTRDHVQLIMELWASTPQARMDEALSICIERNLFSATEFRDVVNYLEKSAHKKELETNITIEVPFYRHETMGRVSKIQTEARSLEAYSELFGGEQLV